MKQHHHLLLFFLAACEPDAAREARERAVLSLAGNRVHGAEVYAATCASCHRPGPTPGECWGLRARVVSAAVYGWGFGKMPPQDQLSEQDLADVAAYASADCVRKPDAGLADAGP